ncbi:MAG: RDD family protein [Verrucomicrobia bacterium]|nr:RDD family protein [Verrucomicrobiota bacterium]
MNYHIAKNGVQSGPISHTEVEAKIQRGEIAPDDLCWTEGMLDWQPVRVRFNLQIQPVAPAQQAYNPYSPPVAGAAALIDPATGIDMNLNYHPGFWWRFLAAFLDGFIMNIAGFVVGLVVGLVGVVIGVGEDGLQAFAMLISIVIGWLYEALMVSSPTQATLGKMACGIRVTDLNGGRISFGRATGRYFGKFISSLILCIGYLMCVWTDRKQCLHDMMAGTLVWRRR